MTDTQLQDDTTLAAIGQDENEVRLTGAVHEEPYIKQTPAGGERASFKLVTMRTFRSGGRRREAFEVHRVVAWDKNVRKVRELKQGNRLTVLGYLQDFHWEDRVTGLPMSRTEIIVKDAVVHHHANV